MAAVRPPDRLIDPDPPGRLRFLVSYGNAPPPERWTLGEYLDRIEERAGPIDCFVDSGAFSAFTRGVELTVEGYAAWVEPVLDRVSAVANLDVIGDPDATWANQLALERRLGRRVVPTLHIGEPWSWLDRYAAQGHTYVALGRAQRSGPGIDRWLVESFRRGRDLGMVFHGFAGLRWQWLLDLPFYSVDSSSWMGSRWGYVYVWDPELGRLVVLHCRRANGPALARGGDLHRYADQLRRQGVRVEHLRDPERFKYLEFDRASVTTLWECERFLRRRHGLVVRPDTGDTGFRCYLAGAESSTKHVMFTAEELGRRPCPSP